MCEPNEDLSDLRALEQLAIAAHMKQAPDAVAIYLDGFIMLHQSLHALKGYNFGDALEQRVMMALFIKTLNSMWCFYELAVLGYYVQALNLMRTPVEDWMGYWFLRNFPARHEEFTKPGLEPPEFNVALQAIESAQNRQRKIAGQLPRQPDKRVRAWMKELHKYSHLSRLGVREVMTIDLDFTHYRLGPADDEAQFHATVAQAIPIVAAHLEAIDNFRRLAGRDPILEFNAYVDRAVGWQRAQAADVMELERKAKSSVVQPRQRSLS